MINLKHFPEMNAYYSMPPLDSPPYAMISNPRNYASPTINTDKYGFRFSLFDGKKVSIEKIDEYDEINILVGGSTVFGMGCSDDSTTIASNLSKKSGQIWLNLGIRSGVSFQEYIHLINHIAKAKKINNIVFFSGINDLYKSFTDTKDTHFDKWFSPHKSEYQPLALSSFSARRLAYAFARSLLSSKSIRSFLPGQFEASQHSELNEDKIFNDLDLMYERNFKLYRSLSHFVENKVSYFLQPFSYWTNKKYTLEENESRAYLESLQSNSEWPSSRGLLNQPHVNKGFINILDQRSSQNNILFCDTNKFFALEESLFVDAVHLNDIGSELAADIILQKIEEP